MQLQRRHRPAEVKDDYDPRRGTIVHEKSISTAPKITEVLRRFVQRIASAV